MNAARTFFESQEQVFQEVELSNDYGKDAYVDFTEDKQILGVCAGFQIKTGASYRRAFGYSIPVKGHFRVWRDSSVPMIGVVHDEQNGKLYWVNISAYLDKCGESEPESIPVNAKAELTAASLTAELLPSVRASKRVDALGNALLQLCSADPEAQIAAISDCFALGRADVRVMLAIRNSLRSFRDNAVKQAIVILSHTVPHPDIAFTDTNRVPSDVERAIEGELIWTQDELVKLFQAAPWSDYWERGSLGQCLYYLLVADPDYKAKVEAVIPALANVDADAAFAAMYLTLFWSDNVREKLEEVLRDNPVLEDHELIGEVRFILDECGRLSMW